MVARITLKILLLVSLTESRRLLEKVPSLKFDLFHINDIHAHFDPINSQSGRCHFNEEECYGGMSRLYHMLKEMRSQTENSVLLNGGDYYQGTMWYSVHKYKVVLDFSNRLNYTAMGVGNHDFDDGIEGLQPFIKGANFPVLGCNLRPKKSDSDFGLKKSYIDESLGVKIGIIGYVTTDTPLITGTDFSQWDFLDEIESIREEAQRLKKDEGVKILIALGHSGYKKDKEIAEHVEEIDVVVGGHSHTFLYPPNKDPPLANDEPKGSYPTYITQPTTGRVVPVVQAYCFSKYLGHLTLNFDEDGELLKPVYTVGVSHAEPYLINGTESAEMNEVMEKYRNELSEFYEKIGISEVDLVPERMKESNLGNLVTDSMAFVAGGIDTIAFINDGGLRSTITKGTITAEDAINLLPFGNTIDIISINGSSIRRVLENIASAWCYEEFDCYSSFLQVSSALNLQFEITPKNQGSRLKSATIKCEKKGRCELEDSTIYQVALPSFIATGGLPSPNFADLTISRVPGNVSDYEALKSYIKEKTPIKHGIEGRILVERNGAFSNSSPSVLLVPILVFFLRMS